MPGLAWDHSFAPALPGLAAAALAEAKIHFRKAGA
jgi:hypothetical protein